jgi:hypothetical protein
MNKVAKIMGIGLISLVLTVILFALLFSIRSSIASIFSSDTPIYSENLNLTFDADSSYLWTPKEDISVGYFGISGYLKGEYAKISLLEQTVYSYGNDNNISSLVVSEGSGEINLEFNYGDYEGYDTNNDGISYKDGIIDFRVNANFNFEADYSKVCTKYTINNIDDGLVDNICYGSVDCCLFLNLESSGNWNDILYLSLGKYGTGYNNTISAQIVYYDVSLNESDLHSNIYSSEIEELNANFVDAVYFDTFLNDSVLIDEKHNSYNLDFVVDGILYIDNISYTLFDNKKTGLRLIDSKIDGNIWRTSISAFGKNNLIIYLNNISENSFLNEIKCGDNPAEYAAVVLEDGTSVPFDAYQKAVRIKEIDEELR